MVSSYFAIYCAVMVFSVLAIVSAVFYFARRLAMPSLIKVYIGPLLLIIAMTALIVWPAYSWETWVMFALLGIWAAQHAYFTAAKLLQTAGSKEKIGIKRFMILYLPTAVFVLLAGTLLGFFAGTVAQSLWYYVGLAMSAIGVVVVWRANHAEAQHAKDKKHAQYACRADVWSMMRYPTIVGTVLLWWGVSIALFAVGYPIILVVSLLLIAGGAVYYMHQSKKELLKKKDGKEYVKSTPLLPFMPRKK